MWRQQVEDSLIEENLRSLVLPLFSFAFDHLPRRVNTDGYLGVQMYKKIFQCIVGIYMKADGTILELWLILFEH
jgi:hypothetical protein